MSLIGCSKTVEKTTKCVERTFPRRPILVTWIRETSEETDFAGRRRTEPEPSPPPRLLVHLLFSRPAFTLFRSVPYLVCGVVVGVASQSGPHGPWPDGAGEANPVLFRVIVVAAGLGCRGNPRCSSKMQRAVPGNSRFPNWAGKRVGLIRGLGLPRIRIANVARHVLPFPIGE